MSLGVILSFYYFEALSHTSNIVFGKISVSTFPNQSDCNTIHEVIAFLFCKT
jgi:hypothetical protein